MIIRGSLQDKKFTLLNFSCSINILPTLNDRFILHTDGNMEFHILTFFVCVFPRLYSCYFTERNKTILRICAQNRCTCMRLHIDSIQECYWRYLFETFRLCSSRWILIFFFTLPRFNFNFIDFFPVLYAHSRASLTYFKFYIFRFRRDALTLPLSVSPEDGESIFTIVNSTRQWTCRYANLEFEIECMEFETSP